jgi:hypothetical protein
MKSILFYTVEKILGFMAHNALFSRVALWIKNAAAAPTCEKAVRMLV